MKHFFTFLATVLFTVISFAQVGIGTTTPDPSAALDVTSSSNGILFPRMTEAERNAILNPATGLMLYCTDCGEFGELQVFNGGVWTNLLGAPAASLPQIGDLFSGGIVFYIAPTPTDLDGDGDLDRGLVCSLEDVVDIQWGCSGTDLPSVPNVPSFPPSGSGAEIGDGMSNTTAILNACPTAPAALATKDLGPNWFLPSIKELNEIYENRAAINATAIANGGDAIPEDAYWSSSEISYNTAWAQTFFGGLMCDCDKINAINVRAVRAF